MKAKISLIWILILCLCACAAAETAAAPTTALLEAVRKDYSWMRADDSLYHGARLHCSLHDGDLSNAAFYSSEESYLETIPFGADTLVVIGTFATSHSVEAFMDSEFMPSGSIERPEYYEKIAGSLNSQYRFTTNFAGTEFAVDAFSFTADETVFLFLIARNAADDAAAQTEYLLQLDDWIQTMQILPAK